jgi:G2/mitotic-specific cyclin-B, other
MRAILIDWLVDVHLKFKLLPESLFLTVNLIDRYLSREKVGKEKLQLVGVTCMLIASKYEEIYAPIVSDFVYITDNAYSKEEILRMERKVISTLNFDLQITSSLRFLERLQRVLSVDPLFLNLSKYFLELALVDFAMLSHAPSLHAAAALYLSLKMAKVNKNWIEPLLATFTHDEQEVRACAKQLFVLFTKAKTSNLQAVRKKFSLPKFNEVALIQVDSQEKKEVSAS